MTPLPHLRFSPTMADIDYRRIDVRVVQQRTFEIKKAAKSGFYLSSTNKKAATSTANQSSVSTMRTVSRPMDTA